MRIDHSLDPEYVRQALRYEDGKIYWRERPSDHFRSDAVRNQWNGKYANKEAGVVLSHHGRNGKDLRHRIHFNGRHYHRSTIVWILCHGEYREELDHEDGDSLNDKIENLRICSSSQNSGNRRMRSDNTSGFKGAWINRGKWVSYITVNYRRIYLGSFHDPEEAHEAYMAAARKYFGGFANDGHGNR